MENFHDAMEAVLRGGKYDVLTGRKPSLEEKIAQLIYNVLEFIFERFNIDFSASNASVNPGLIKNIFILGAVLILLIAMGFLGGYLVRRTRRGALAKDIFDEFRENPMTLDELLAYARHQGQAGAYAMALRYEYIAMITCFSNSNIVYITPSMTGNQFRRGVKSAAPQFFAGVDKTVHLFYRLWFGKKSISPEDFILHQEMYHAMIEEARHFEQTK